ncbi:GntR family transcriptional regulator [Halalkalibacter oceani]|uniref:GntR family transcriptional regulator n=1 Tax=Halalkalibacter oceani TaxID=1653776 RepID=UPI00339372DF
MTELLFAEQIKQATHVKVANYIRKGILTGKWAFREHLNEKLVSEELGLSRGPVRDAIKQLHIEGLIEIPGNGRPYVVGFSDKSFADWCRMRTYLETLAIQESVEAGDSRAYHEMTEIVKAMESVAAAEREPYIWLDLYFHRRLVESSQNRALCKLWETLSPCLYTLLELIAERYDQQKQIGMHQEILTHLQRGESRQAIDCMTTHIQAGKQTVEQVVLFSSGRG